MKRTLGFVAALILALNFWGCSSSGPQADEVGIGDQTPVVGQRVLLQVMAETDNPPMRYVWNCPNGRLEGLTTSLQAGVSTDQYFAYWVPQDVGQYTVTCTVIDAANNEETIGFPLTVTARGVYCLANQGVRHIAKDQSARSGGIWTAIQGSNLQYYCANGTTDAGWGRDVFIWTDPDPISALAASTYISTYYAWSNLWAVRKRAGVWELLSHSTNGDTTYACANGACAGINEVRAVEVNNGTVWIGTDAGLFSFSAVGQAWSGPVAGISSVKDIYAADSLVYVATMDGVQYTSDNGVNWSPFITGQDTTALTGYKDLSSGVLTIYARTNTPTGYQIQSFNSDGSSPTPLDLAHQPADAVAKGLDSDTLGNIWFGKHVWDARLQRWDSPASAMTITGLDDSGDPVERSLVSPEGLVYLRTVNGKLYVWGK